ncbi:MAG: lytic transglycosylase domain-containing protein [Thermodesulfovibrionales bacterium]
MRRIKKDSFLLAMLILLSPAIASSFCYDEAANRYNINPQLLKAIALSETGENPSLINLNKNGSLDFGLMQINSSWIEIMNLDKQALLSDPCYNVMVGAAILKYCIQRHGYTWEAIGCYNAKNKLKRISYSWKVYRTLLRLKKSETITTKKEPN